MYLPPVIRTERHFLSYVSDPPFLFVERILSLCLVIPLQIEINNEQIIEIIKVFFPLHACFSVGILSLVFKTIIATSWIFYEKTGHWLTLPFFPHVGEPHWEMLLISKNTTTNNFLVICMKEFPKETVATFFWKREKRDFSFIQDVCLI